ncbi:hypothetical protein CPB83DRAFT_56457 [Crepidotus variabilis]|uniref:Uncharacterized protein n=1 Tax=Crepidotus variabilis TaxID=179855 RepID=A0A9P6JTM9_9AGAR|nr:hypothetical protein CPB83DRAFT_56457 [Crepidotus variabilis]
MLHHITYQCILCVNGASSNGHANIFVLTHLKVDGMNELAQLRPDGFGHILDIIQTIMQPEGTLFPPLDELDVAQCVLVRWGEFVPWTWSIWNDPRTANSEVLRFLTSTWLYHLNTPLYASIFDAYNQPNLAVDLRSVLLKNIPSSSAMILQVFQETLKNLECSQVLLPSFRITLNKVCWSIVQYFEIYLSHQDVTSDDRFSEFGKLLLVAAVHSRLREDGYILRDLIVEALVLTPTGIVDSLTKSVIADKKALFMTCLDETIRHSLKIPSTQDEFSMTNFSVIKSILEFCCVLLSHPSCGDAGLKTAASVYLERVFTLLVQEGPDSTGTTVILGAFLTLLGTLRRHKYAVNIIEDELWALITPNCYLDITIPFTHYVFGTLDRPRDPLLTLEAWDHILSTFRMIVDEQMTDEEEPLALLAVPCLCYTICGISSSSNTSDSTRFHLRASPWTQTMLLSVGQLLDSEWPDGSFGKTLQGRLQLRSIGRAFLKEFGVQTSEEETESRSGSQSTAWAAQFPRLVYYRDSSFSGLIPVLDID